MLEIVIEFVIEIVVEIGIRCSTMVLACGFFSITWIPDSADQTVNHRRSSVSGRSSTVLEQSARQRHVSQFVVGFPAATETYTVPAVIPRHFRVTFLNCNSHSGLAVALLLRPV